jgi:hypothetical protein
MAENNQYPSISEQGKNLAKFVWDVMKESFNGHNESLFVSDEIYNERMEICRSCEYYDDNLEHHNLPGGKIVTCIKCGCWLTAKAKMSLDSCPLKKWNANSDTFINEKFEELMKDLDKKKESE